MAEPIIPEVELFSFMIMAFSMGLFTGLLLNWFLSKDVVKYLKDKDIEDMLNTAIKEEELRKYQEEEEKGNEPFLDK